MTSTTTDQELVTRQLEDLYFEEATATITVESAVLFSKKANGLKVYCVVFVEEGLWSSKGRSQSVTHTGTPKWNFQFKSVFSSLGTNDSPTKLRIEVWGERFLIDTFLGQVVLVLPKFADLHEHRLQLPISIDPTHQQQHQQQQSQQKPSQPSKSQAKQVEQEGTIDIKLHVSIDVNSLMTEDEIRNCYKALIKHRPATTPYLDTITEKWHLIQSILEEEFQLRRELEEQNKPSHFVYILRSANKEIPSSDWRRLKFNLSDEKWQEEFFSELSGVEYLFFRLSKLLLHLKTRVVAHSHKDRQTLTSILLCLERAKSFKSLWITHDYIRELLGCLKYVDSDDRLIVFTVVNTICKSHALIVLESFIYYVYSHGSTFEKLMEDLFTGGDLLFKKFMLQTLNAIFEHNNSATTENFKFQFLELCLKNGLDIEKLKEFNNHFPDDEVLEQVNELVTITEDILDKRSAALLHRSPKKKRPKKEVEIIQEEPKEQEIQPKSSREADLEKQMLKYKEENEALLQNISLLKQQLPSTGLKKPTIIGNTPSTTTAASPSVASPTVDTKDDKSTLKNFGLPFAPDSGFSTFMLNILENPTTRRRARTVTTRARNGTLGDENLDNADENGVPVAPPPPPPPISVVPPPPPPPPPPPGTAPPPPPPVPGTGSSDLTPKSAQKVLNLRLKTLNANEVKETVFSELQHIDSEKSPINLQAFLENFSSSSGSSSSSAAANEKKKKMNVMPANTEKQENVLCDAKRKQQLAIFLKKSPVSIHKIRDSLQNLRLNEGISFEVLELLSSLFSKKNEQEIQSCRDFQGNPLDLSEPERFLLGAYSITRLQEKIELLNFKIQFTSLRTDTEENVKKIQKMMEGLNTKEFKLLLAYIIDVANILNTTGKKLQAFQLASLAKLAELKSPTDNKMSCLHYLVEMLEEKAVNLIHFIEDNSQIAKEASIAMANLQTIFPIIIERLWSAELELYYSKDNDTEADYCNNVIDFKNALQKDSQHFNTEVLAIDDQIVFFGNHQNELPPNSTMREIKKMWTDLQQKGILSEAQSSERSKRDEDRYSFFMLIEHFFEDVKKARAYVNAKRVKDIQKATLLKKLQSDTKENTSLDDIARQEEEQDQELPREPEIKKPHDSPTKKEVIGIKTRRLTSETEPGTKKRKTLNEYKRDRRANSGGKLSLSQETKVPKNRSFTTQTLDSFNNDSTPFVRPKLSTEFQKWLHAQPSEAPPDITTKTAITTSRTTATATTTTKPTKLHHSMKS